MFSVLQRKTKLEFLGKSWYLLPHILFTICDPLTMSNEEVLKLKELAALLKVGEKTVYSMAQAGELPGFKIRGQWRFARKDIDKWIEIQKQTAHQFNEDDHK